MQTSRRLLCQYNAVSITTTRRRTVPEENHFEPRWHYRQGYFEHATGALWNFFFRNLEDVIWFFICCDRIIYFIVYFCWRRAHTVARLACSKILWVTVQPRIEPPTWGQMYAGWLFQGLGYLPLKVEIDMQRASLKQQIVFLLTLNSFKVSSDAVLSSMTFFRYLKSDTTLANFKVAIRTDFKEKSSRQKNTYIDIPFIVRKCSGECVYIFSPEYQCKNYIKKPLLLPIKGKIYD